MKHILLKPKQMQVKKRCGEKSPISLMKNKSIDEITANNGKTFAQMRAEIDLLGFS